MRLSEFDGKFGLSLVRDGYFDGTGKLSTPLPGRLVPLRSARYLDDVNAAPNVAAVITLPELGARLNERIAVAVCADPDTAHSEVHVECAVAHERQLRLKPTLIHPDALVDDRAIVTPYGVTIGARAVIGPNAVIYAGVTIDEDCHVRANCVLGGAAFNLGRAGGRRRILPALGRVRICQGAELAAGVCIDSAMFGGETTVGPETAIDHQAYIAHDVQLGRRVTVCGHVAIMGRVVVGDEAYVGPGSVIVNGAEIGCGAKISMGAVVTRDVPDGGRVSGNFALPHEKFLANLRRDR